jgi:hypothetical protein
MKPFDEQFSDNVRDVFDAWQEPVDEQAWQQMKSRLQSGKKKSLLLLYPLQFAAAAAVLLIAGMSLWLLEPSEDLVMISSTVDQQQSVAIQPGDELLPAEEGVNEALAQRQALSDASATNNHQQQNRAVSPATGTIIKSSDIIQEPSWVVSSPGADTTYQLYPQPIIPEQLADVKEIIPEEIPVPVMKYIPDDKAIIDYNLSFVEPKSAVTQGNGVEISAGSLKTWSMAEVAGGMGYAAGITRHWNLGRNFSIGSGGSFVYNSFSLEDPMAARQSPSGYYADYSPERNADNSSKYLTIRRDKNTDMDFMAIDIPVNFRYDISSIGKGKLYVSAGLSSLIYLNENFTSQSEYLTLMPSNGISGDSSYSSTVSKVNTSGSFGALNRIDLGRFINFSFGYRLNRKKQSLLIEPFMKYPLGNVTSMQLNIGMAGINLKYDIAHP